MQYEKDYSNKKIMKRTIKDKDIRNIASDLIKIKQLLKQTQGSIKYQYLKKYPDVIKEIDNLSRKIIDSSLDIQEQIDKYILARQKIVAFKYSDELKIQEAQKQEKQKAEEDILFLKNPFCRGSVRHIYVYFQNSLRRFENFKFDVVCSVGVFVIVGKIFLPPAVTHAVYFNVFGHDFAQAGRYADKKVRETNTPFGSYGEKRLRRRVVVDSVNKTRLNKLGQSLFAVNVTYPVVGVATQIENRVFRQWDFHLVENKQKQQFVLRAVKRHGVGSRTQGKM